MKKFTISLLSILAVAFMLTGCGETDGSISGSSDKESTSGVSNNGNDGKVDDTYTANNGNVGKTTVTNEFGLNSSLGVPPALPAE